MRKTGTPKKRRQQPLASWKGQSPYLDATGIIAGCPGQHWPGERGARPATRVRRHIEKVM